MEVILRSDHALLEKLIKNQTKNTLTQNWALDTFLITPYITLKHIKGKDNILANSLTQLQRLGLYEKSPCQEDDKDHKIIIFDEGESIKITADPEPSTTPDLDMIHTVTDNTSANANHYLDKDTFVLNGVIYVIDDEHPIKPQIYLMPQQIKEYNYRISHLPS